MQKWFIVISWLLFCGYLHAQRFGGTPPGVHWKQINTDTARIIFHGGLDSQAQRVAALVHEQASKPSLGSRHLKKINIVLQPQTVISNGYVGLGPYRSEFYLTPPANSFDQGSVSWIDQLALHEYRHVQQFNHFNNGISRLMSVLFGEEGYALATNASIPDWFYEGDAVYFETVSTRQGRGRLPSFMNDYPTLWKAGKKYSWMKMRNGSWKDYVPGHYQLGYWLVNYGYLEYGSEFWPNVTKDASAFKGLFYPFQKAIKRYAGTEFKSFRSSAFKRYKLLADSLQAHRGTLHDAGNKAGEAPVRQKDFVFPVNTKYVTDYLFPYYVSKDSLLYLKRTYRHRPAFYISDSHGQHRLRTRDISIDDQFSYRAGKIVYAAYENDPRWRWRDYSVIKILDIHSNQQKTLTKKSKYFTPDISPGGQKIVAVENNPNGQSALHILNVNTGDVEKKLSLPGVQQFSDPKFIGEDSVVAAIRFNNGEMAMAIVDMHTDQFSLLTPRGFAVVGYPCVVGNTIYFTASYEGTDNIFAVSTTDKRIYRVSTDFSGQYFVNGSSSGSLVWSAFTAEGYQLKEKQNVAFKEQMLFQSGNKLFEAYPVAKDPGSMTIQSVERIFRVTKYSRAKRLINFHSWRPYYEDPEFSFSLYGQNVLNTLETEVYYLYNQNEKTNAVGFNTTYGGWFPYISAGFQYTFDRRQVLDSITRSWNQLDARIGLSVPLTFTTGRTTKSLTIGSDYVFRADKARGASAKEFGNTSFSYLAHRITFSQQVQQAVQHIFPRLGYAVTVQHRHAITNYSGWQFLAGATVYLPGIATTHHLVLTGALQQRDTMRALFANRLAFSRGYNELYPSLAWRGSANYHLPLVYPDWGFANILYLQRVRANCFFDYSKLYSNNRALTVDQRSAGVELFVDTKWWNQYELSFGLRVARLLDNDLLTGQKETVFEFILPVSIFPR